jgi:competence protein ComEA
MRAVTALKSLGINLVMLAVASGFLFWVLQEGPDSPPEQPGTARQGQGQGMTSPVLQTPLASSDQSESEGESPGGERLAPNQAPAPALSSPATRAGSAKPAALARRPVTFPLDLNTAKLEDFIELPGIGEKLAQRLVDYRQSHGGFRSVEDLREVRGIGAKRFERLRPLVVTAVAP